MESIQAISGVCVTPTYFYGFTPAQSPHSNT